jgi:Xaa-Pro aminopeptidase
LEIPVNLKKLDALLDDSGAEWVLATSKHNTRYLLGGHDCHFFSHFQAIGLSRYLPLVAYRRGHPEDSFFLGSSHDAQQLEVTPVWVPELVVVPPAVHATVEAALAELERRGVGRGRIGVELPFLPGEALDELRRGLPSADLVDSTVLLEELRAVKSPEELEFIRAASVGVVESMLDTFRLARVGETTHSVMERFNSCLTDRGLNFEYALIAAGDSCNRVPSTRTWNSGEILSLDSGAELHGYIGDLCRMAVWDGPSPALECALAEVESVQTAARCAVRAGALGFVIGEVANRALLDCPHAHSMQFVAHGMGLVSHEPPHLTTHSGVPYPATHADRPLEAGMVLSIETHISDGELGFVKLEDTVIVTQQGCEGVGDEGRGWNLAAEVARPAGTGRN